MRMFLAIVAVAALFVIGGIGSHAFFGAHAHGTAILADNGSGGGD